MFAAASHTSRLRRTAPRISLSGRIAGLAFKSELENATGIVTFRQRSSGAIKTGSETTDESAIAVNENINNVMKTAKNFVNRFIKSFKSEELEIYSIFSTPTFSKSEKPTINSNATSATVARI